MNTKGHAVEDCPIGLEVCFPSCHWWGMLFRKCFYPKEPINKIKEEIKMEQPVGLYYLRDKLGQKTKPSSQLGVYPVKGPDGEYYRIIDPEGRQLVLGRQDATVVYLALGVGLKANERQEPSQ